MGTHTHKHINTPVIFSFSYFEYCAFNGVSGFRVVCFLLNRMPPSERKSFLHKRNIDKLWVFLQSSDSKGLITCSCYKYTLNIPDFSAHIICIFNSFVDCLSQWLFTFHLFCNRMLSWNYYESLLSSYFTGLLGLSTSCHRLCCCFVFPVVQL